MYLYISGSKNKVREGHGTKPVMNLLYSLVYNIEQSIALKQC